jgi:hypothetical protein
MSVVSQKKQYRDGDECRRKKCNFTHPSDEGFATARVVSWQDTEMQTAKQMKDGYDRIFSDPKQRASLRNFFDYSEEVQRAQTIDDAQRHLKVMLQREGCWVKNPSNGRYDMDYCLGEANRKRVLT